VSQREHAQGARAGPAEVGAVGRGKRRGRGGGGSLDPVELFEGVLQEVDRLGGVASAGVVSLGAVFSAAGVLGSTDRSSGRLFLPPLVFPAFSSSDAAPAEQRRRGLPPRPGARERQPRPAARRDRARGRSDAARARQQRSGEVRRAQGERDGGATDQQLGGALGRGVGGRRGGGGVVAAVSFGPSGRGSGVGGGGEEGREPLAGLGVGDLGGLELVGLGAELGDLESGFRLERSREKQGEREH